MSKGRRKSGASGASSTNAAGTPLPDTATRTPLGDPPVDRDRIAQRAYELYLQRGGDHGQDQDDWYAAERELNQNESLRARDNER